MQRHGDDEIRARFYPLRQAVRQIINQHQAFTEFQRLHQFVERESVGKYRQCPVKLRQAFQAATADVAVMGGQRAYRATHCGEVGQSIVASLAP